jgi:hypothetical protein
MASYCDSIAAHTHLEKYTLGIHFVKIFMGNGEQFPK